MNAQVLYEILDGTVGSPTMKEDFIFRVAEALKTGERLEYRFMGHLGFGGKLWINSSSVPYVTCYMEDETAGRKALIAAANRELEQLK